MAYTDLDKPSLYFNAKAYNGDGTTSNTITGIGFQSDMVWFKSRSTTDSHFLTDSVRGITKYIRPQGTNAEETETTAITSLTSDGYVLSTAGNVNDNNVTYASWNWKKVAGVFDIQTYTGNGSNRTISHNLGTVPKMMIIKKRNTSAPWSVGHASLGANQVLELDAQDAVATDNSYWNNTRPTSSVFSLGTDGNQNTNTHTYVIYLFGEKQGMSKMGNYEGNGNADGTFVYLGFKPAWLIVKPMDAADNWVNFDNKRLGFNSGTSPFSLHANQSFVETTDTKELDFLSNGFKIRNSGNTINRTSTFIYMAFAESPFVTSTGVPTTAE